MQQLTIVDIQSMFIQAIIQTEHLQHAKQTLEDALSYICTTCIDLRASCLYSCTAATIGDDLNNLVVHNRRHVRAAAQHAEL